MLNDKTVSTLIVQYFKLLAVDFPLSDVEREDMEIFFYESVVGSFIYLMICTRSNLAYGASLVRYIRGTTRVSLLYDHSKELRNGVLGFVDFNFVGDRDNRSIMGYLFSFGGNMLN